MLDRDLGLLSPPRTVAPPGHHLSLPTLAVAPWLRRQGHSAKLGFTLPALDRASERAGGLTPERASDSLQRQGHGSQGFTLPTLDDAPLLRELRFAAGAARIYGRLKAAQVLVAARRLDKNEEEARWSAIHRSVGGDLYRLCADLGGFHIKTGQFFAGRPDLVPKEWTYELSALCDAVEPMDGKVARRIAEEELARMQLGPLTEWVDTPLGSASVAQVHAARLPPPAGRLGFVRWLRGPACSRPVAIKVRRPEVRRF